MAVDANILVYSMNTGSPDHGRANAALADALASGEVLFLFPPTLAAVLRVATHQRLLTRPLSLEDAIRRLREFLALPVVQFGIPGDDFLEDLAEAALEADSRGNVVHDAEIVALMKTHGVGRILTADRDFLRFDGIEVTLLSP